ncbi:MAG: hypothetical protein M0Z91_04940 [Actinomycetota bacterium]|nr:hypothetical protein [Actinomycetota bacterium]
MAGHGTVPLIIQNGAAETITRIGAELNSKPVLTLAHQVLEHLQHLIDT